MIATLVEMVFAPIADCAQWSSPKTPSRRRLKSVTSMTRPISPTTPNLTAYASRPCQRLARALPSRVDTGTSYASRPRPRLNQAPQAAATATVNGVQECGSE